jgi:hypothetical protein
MRKRTNRNIRDEVRKEWIEIKDSRTKEKVREISKIKEKGDRRWKMWVFRIRKFKARNRNRNFEIIVDLQA